MALELTFQYEADQVNRRCFCPAFSEREQNVIETIWATSKNGSRKKINYYVSSQSNALPEVRKCLIDLEVLKRERYLPSRHLVIFTVSNFKKIEKSLNVLCKKRFMTLKFTETVLKGFPYAPEEESALSKEEIDRQWLIYYQNIQDSLHD